MEARAPEQEHRQARQNRMRPRPEEPLSPTGLESAKGVADNQNMVIPGRVKNGIVVLEGRPSLPDGTPVLVSCDVALSMKQPAEKRVEFPLIHSKRPGSLHLTAQRVAELLEEDDVSS